MCAPGAATASSEPIRKRNVTVCPARFGPMFIIVTPALSRTLSLIPFWSPTKASLGGLSGVTVVVTHRTPSPGSGLVAVQPVGSAGAVTPSQFSTHGPAGVGDGDAPPGVDVAVAVAVGTGVPPGVADEAGPPPPRSYASTKPTPVPLFFPASSAV